MYQDSSASLASRQPGPSDPRADQRMFIARARELLKPSPVIGGIPAWFRLKLLRLRRECRGGARSFSGDVHCSSNAGWALVNWARDFFHWRWIDHFGCTEWRGGMAFVSEPYGLTRDDVDAIDDFAQRIDCAWDLHANSWHYPSRTLRILIYEKDNPQQ
ncbi:MAG: hypothetical protein ACLP9L_14680 [Thermoguttaceae bacterium]